MKRVALGLLVLGLLAPETSAWAADMATDVDAGHYRTIRKVRHAERRVYVGCPDGVSCYPLYGAYGPYGGKAYWAAYTGWYR